MIVVRIPQEIRKYKEAVLLGMNARQLVAVVLTLGVCVPLFFFARAYIPDDVLSWIIIVIALPLLSIGFLRPNGMPAEKFFLTVLRSGFLYPARRTFKSVVAFREWQNEADRLEAPKTIREKAANKKFRHQASLERAVLMAEAQERGEVVDIKDSDLLTVRTPGGGGKKPKGDKSKKSKDKEGKTKSSLQKKVELIEQKQAEQADYIPTAREMKILATWNAKQLALAKKEIEEKTKDMSTKSRTMEKRREARSAIPRSTQQSIPYIADYIEGMFEVSPNKYSKMFKLQDVNYSIAAESDQVEIFCKLGEFYNYFSEDAVVQLVVDNRYISLEEQERRILYPMVGDAYDRHREEYNNILRRQIAAGNNDMQVEKFLLVTIDADTPIEALLRFHKVEAEVISGVQKIGADAKLLTSTERLAYYHDKFRHGREGDFQIDFDTIKAAGISSKDYIAPTLFLFRGNHFRIEDDFYRVLFLNNLPSSLPDTFLQDLYKHDFSVTVSLSIQPVAQDNGLKVVRKQRAGIGTNKIDAEKRAVKSGYSPESIQPSIKEAYAQAETLYEDMTKNNQRMFFVTITCMVHGSSLDELNENCKMVEGAARRSTAQLQTLTSQQEEGMKITLPFGYPPLDTYVDRMLTTESLSIFMPFSNQELFQPGGFYYGMNPISQSLIFLDRTKMDYGSGFVLGKPGAGKSFATKRELLNVLLTSQDTTVIIIDPENEYGDFARAFGGEVLKISADSNVRINPMDMSPDYGLDEDDGEDTPLSTKKYKALKKKAGYIMAVVERMLTPGDRNVSSLTPQQRSLVDRCVERCYKNYLDHDFDLNHLPTLLDLQKEFEKEKADSGTEDARLVAEGVEYYTRGSMDLFAYKTNSDINNRLVVFNIRDLGGELKEIAMTIIFDFIWNKMVENKNKGVRTYCYADEIHVMFYSWYSAYFLKQLYKRGRKYGLNITGITQNIEELLRSEQARSMVNVSDFVMMLNQSSEDLAILASILPISTAQMKYVSGVEAGSGLIFAENVIVPFVDRFPDDSYLYTLMSTKFGEDLSQAEVKRRIDSIMGRPSGAAQVSSP